MLRMSKLSSEILSLCTSHQVKSIVSRNIKNMMDVIDPVHNYNGVKGIRFCNKDVRRLYSNLAENSTMKSKSKTNDPDLDVLTSSADQNLKTGGVIPGKGPPPDPPIYCCMSGCSTCVWLEYADELVKYYEDGGPMAVQAVKDNVDDPNLKSFILLELSMKGFK